jgi:hypothetical protein
MFLEDILNLFSSLSLEGKTSVIMSGMLHLSEAERNLAIDSFSKALVSRSKFELKMTLDRLQEVTNNVSNCPDKVEKDEC